MAGEKICAVCKRLVDWDVVLEEFPEYFMQANQHGIESLTEHEQMVIEGRCCSLECFENLR